MKVSLDANDQLSSRPRARYVVVSAITPTPPGEGRTTTVGRGQAGAGFVYPAAGEMRTVPGLGAEPVATRSDLDDDGATVGLS